MRKAASLYYCIILIAAYIVFPSCGAIKSGRGTALASAAGGSIGALIGKKAGNPAIGATIGAAIGGSTGAFLSSKLTRVTDTTKNNKKLLYVINGTPYKVKEAQYKLNFISPAEIQSVEVLNHHQAIALYGAKGGNGAILITVKNTTKI